MVLDIIVVVIFLISTIRGKTRGFGDAIIHLASLIGGIALGAVAANPVRDFLLTTTIDEQLIKKLNEIIVDGQVDLFGFIPGTLGQMISESGIGTIQVDTAAFAGTALLVLSFVLIIVIVAFIAWILRLFLKKNRQSKTLIGAVDSNLGFIVGAIKGALLVCLFLAFMFPLAGVLMPDKIHAINESLNNSYIAGPLYDVNPIMILLRKLPF